jgi:heat shock protein HslJ
VKRSIALILAAMSLAACSATGSPASPSPAAGSVDGRTFLSTTVTGRDLVPGTTIRVSFKDGQLSVNAGCNHIGAAYSITDGRLHLGSMLSTGMGCDQALMAQDGWVSAFFGGATVALAGDALTLANGGVTMNLTDRRVADPDRPLVGTRWVVDGVIAGEATSSIPMGVTAALTFSTDRIAVETGCNTGGGTVSIQPTSFTVGPIGLTKKACEPAASLVENAIIAALNGQVGYTIEADRLTLTNGQAGLTLQAAR